MIKHNRRRRGGKKWILAMLIVALPLVYLIRRAERFISSVREETRLRKTILIVQAENQVLQQRIDDYRKGVILEAKARDDLGMIKKGEKIYLLKP